MSAILVLFIFLLLSSTISIAGLVYALVVETAVINKIIINFGVLGGLLLLYADIAYVLPLI